MSENEIVDGSSPSASPTPFDPTAKLMEFVKAQAVPAAPGSAFANGEGGEPSPADVAKTAARRQQRLEQPGGTLAAVAQQVLGQRQAPAAPPAPVVAPQVPPATPGALLRPPADVKAPVSPAQYDPTKDPEAPLEVQSGKDQKAINAWTRSHREIKELKQALADEVAAREAASKVKPVELEELAKLKTQVDSYEEQIGKLSIIESRSFKERYEAPLQQHFSRGVGILIKAGKPQEEAVKTMRELIKPGNTQEQVQELLGDVATAYQGAVLQTTFDLQDTVAKREQAIQEWKATKAALSDGENRTSMADLSKMLVEGTTTAAERLAQEQSWLFVESKQDTGWNKQREDLVSAARHILRENKPDELIKYVLEGVAASRYRAFAEAESKRADGLLAELNERAGIRPRVGGGAVVDGVPAEPAPKTASVETFVNQYISKANQR